MRCTTSSITCNKSHTTQLRCKHYMAVNTYIDLCKNIYKSTVVIG